MLVARAGMGDRAAVSVCGYLVDTYCLGVKDALGPRPTSRSALRRFADRFFEVFPGGLVEAPVDLAGHLVWGAVEYARGLGFEPHPDFGVAAVHLPSQGGPSAIRFGRHGTPFYVQGPYDDARRIMATLRARVGDDFGFIVELDPEELAPAG